MTVLGRYKPDHKEVQTGQLTFNITFQFVDTDDIRATVTDQNTGLDNELVPGVDFTVAGTVLTTAAQQPAGDELTIYVDNPFTQTSDYANTGKFDLEQLESDLDKAALERQQLSEEVARSVKVPVTDPESADDLLDSIYDARDTAVASATAAGGSATDAGQSAADAAASAEDAAESVIECQDIVASVQVNKSVRQATQITPDLITTPDHIIVAATLAGAIGNNYQDTLGLDCLTGANGFLVLIKPKGIGATNLQSSMLPETRSRLLTSDASPVDTATQLTQQPLASGLQLGSDSILNSANLLAFNTNQYEVMADGGQWAWHDSSGFFIAVVPGVNGVAGDWQHPMGKAPLWFDVKNKAIAYSHYTGRYGSANYMNLDGTIAELPDSTIFPKLSTDTYLSLGTANVVSNGDLFIWGWVGDPLDDLFEGARGTRGTTVSAVVKAGTVETGVPVIKTVFLKSISEGDWIVANDTDAFATYTTLNSINEEVPIANLLTVNGSEVTVGVDWGALDVLIIVIGSTAARSSTTGKTGTEVLRKVGTGASGHRVDVGPMAGIAGGFGFGRVVGAIANNYFGDTISGGGKTLYTNLPNAQATSNAWEAFTYNGFTLGVNPDLNPTALCQYSTFLTNQKTTTSDSLDWDHNLLTGVGMVEVVKSGAGAMTIKHPGGKNVQQIWAKRTDVTEDGIVYLGSLGATKYMKMFATDGTVAAITSSTAWNDTEPTDDEITLGSLFATGGTYMLYCWFGADQVPDADVGVAGMPGVSAFWPYVGGSGDMSVDTGLVDISYVLIKTSDSVQGWLWVNLKTQSYYDMSGTTTEVVNYTAFTVDGSVLKWDAVAVDYEFMVFSSQALSGIDDQVILPASLSEPFIGSIAAGFDEVQGQLDTIVSVSAQQSMTVTGSAGFKGIFIGTDGLLGFVDTPAEYLRNYTPYAKGNYVYDIDREVMTDATGADNKVLFTGECELDAEGNVLALQTYKPKDIIEIDLGSWLPNTVYSAALPFGHGQIDLDLFIEDVSDVNNKVKQNYYVESTSFGAFLTIEDRVIKVITGAGTFQNVTGKLKLVIRRTF